MLYLFYWIFGIIISIVAGVVWGYVAQSIIYNKGYSDDWFWWGFFFGVWAVLIALVKPDISYSNYGTNRLQKYNSPIFSEESFESKEQTLKAGGWSCKCGRVNPSYTGTCVCGLSKDYVLHNIKRNSENDDKTTKNTEKKFDEILKYKQLLDAGVISQDEFDKKKKEILNM